LREQNACLRDGSRITAFSIEVFMLTGTVSGSFHRFMSEIERAVYTLAQMGVKVVSPADPRVVDSAGEFLFVASDRVRSIRMVQDRHLEAIAASDFVWLVSPDGYVGQSASMEIGFAVANNVPIFSTALPTDLTLRHYVQKVAGIERAVVATRACRRPRPATFLIDPHASIESAHRTLARIDRVLKRPPAAINDETAVEIYADCAQLASMLPSRTLALP
jgi:hypothetical protein